MEFAQENNGNHPILTLPEEIRGKIFNKLPQNEVLKLRLVCKKWESEIKNLFNFSIKFDERSPYCHQILGLRIVNLEIDHLMDYEYRIGNSTPDPTRQRPELIFQRPNLVRSLSFKQFKRNRYSNRPNEKVLPENVGELLTFFSKSLKSLWLGLSFGIMSHKFLLDSFYDFQNLETLRINVDIDFSIRWGDPERTDSILAQFGRSKFPKLKTLNVGGISRDFSITFQTIIKIMNKNPKGLKRLGLFLDTGGCHPHPLHVDKEDLKNLASVTNLEAIEIKLRIVLGHHKIDDIVAVLSDGIQNQGSLRIVDISNDGLLPTAFPVNENLLQWINLNNFETLVTVILDAINPDGGKPIDLSVFKNCLKLTSLALGRYEKFPIVPLSPELSDLMNFNDLPPNIINLSFRRFNILTADLLSLLDSKTVQRSETLELMNCGNSDDFGINFEVIEKIVCLRMIEYLKPVVRLEGFNASDLQRFTKDFKKVWMQLRSGILRGFSMKFVSWDEEPEYILDEAIQFRPMCYR